jgi:hypothetical protein
MAPLSTNIAPFSLVLVGNGFGCQSPCSFPVQDTRFDGDPLHATQGTPDILVHHLPLFHILQLHGEGAS